MEEEDTIELIDYLRVVWKYRYLIVIGVVVCAAAAAAWSFSLPKLYRVFTILEVNSETRKNFPSIIAANIKAGMFNSQIREKMAEASKSSNTSHFSFKTFNPKESNMIRITYETADIKTGQTILEFLNRVIIERYQKEFDKVKDLVLLQEEIKKNCKARIDAISNQIELIDNTIVQRQKDKKRVRIEDVSGLILLRGSLRDSHLEQESLLLETENRLVELKSSYEEGEPVKTIQKPTSHFRPVRSRIKLNILLACVVGFFLFVFLAFFIEYIKNVPKTSRKVD